MNDEDQSQKRFFIRFPERFEDLSEEEQEQAVVEMARDAQRAQRLTGVSSIEAGHT